MKTNPTYHTILFLLALFSFSCSRNTPAGRERIRLTNDWKFILADRAEFSEPAYKDSAWRTLQLPHDWSIEGEFSETHPASAGGGALPGGTGWYRKHFRVDSADVNRQIHIDFDGIYRHSDVWINGHHLGHRPNGYISFRYNLTPYLRYEENNVLAVRVDNSRQPNSRWYSGSGIYRNVWLVKTNKVHVAHWGTFVTTPEVSREKAIIRIETLLHNNDRLPRRVYLRTVLLDAKGATLISADDSVAIPAGGQQMCKQHMQVMNPALWSVDNPYLYRIKTLVNEKGKNIDTYTTDLGIRCFEFDAEKGFFLNGQPTKILGVCLHHDLGCLGTAVNNRALERRLELLKAMGCNAIRTTHNPPAPELLALCDRMGFIVQDEAFDMWRKKKSSYDYALDFPQWHERDLTDQIRRDRNHPSVVMWSIGNEVLEQWNDVHADTLSLQEASLLLNFEKQESAGLEQKEEMNVNALLTSKLAGIVRELDPTRPVTTGNNEVNPSNNLFRSDAMELYGFNYHHRQFADFPKNYPEKKLIISESTSGLMSRGYYEMPSDSIRVWPHRGKKAGQPYGNPQQQCSAYDNCHVPWGSTHEESWKEVRDHDHIAGLFIWTGFDYLGEPTPYQWPSRSSYFGIIDLAGFPKDVYYLYESEWTDHDVLHIFPHWNWEKGQTVDVWAYTNADEVELSLNGKSLGIRQKTKDKLHLMWRVPYEPGTLKAVSYKGGQPVQEREIHTAGESAQIRLTADRDQLQANGYDLSYITVEVLDAKGNPVPRAANRVHFETDGPGFIAGVSNGDPTSHDSLKGTSIKAFHGKCQVVIQSAGFPGTVQLTARSEKLPEAEIRLSFNH